MYKVQVESKQESTCIFLNSIVVTQSALIVKLTYKESELKVRTGMFGEFNSQTSIFVGNLSEDITENDLLSLFKDFGFIVYCNVSLS